MSLLPNHTPRNAAKDKSEEPAREYCRAVQVEVEMKLKEEHLKLELMTGFPFTPDKDPKELLKKHEVQCRGHTDPPIQKCTI